MSREVSLVAFFRLESPSLKFTGEGELKEDCIDEEIKLIFTLFLTSVVEPIIIIAGDDSIKST